MFSIFSRFRKSRAAGDELAALLDAHKHSMRNRKSIADSTTVGCFYCLQMLSPSEINDWIEEYDPGGETALCPRCGIDALVGSDSGLTINDEFLRSMHRHFFN